MIIGLLNVIIIPIRVIQVISVVCFGVVCWVKGEMYFTMLGELFAFWLLLLQLFFCALAVICSVVAAYGANGPVVGTALLLGIVVLACACAAVAAVVFVVLIGLFFYLFDKITGSNIPSSYLGAVKDKVCPLIDIKD